MITEINIKNFKSIVDLTLPLSNINVFIGENGCGKSNILEAVGFACAANTPSFSRTSYEEGGHTNKFNSQIDSEKLSRIGIRGAKPSLIFNSFVGDQSINGTIIKFSFAGLGLSFNIKVLNLSDPFPKWVVQGGEDFIPIGTILNDLQKSERLNIHRVLSEYLIYTLNTAALRGLSNESKAEPVGINGENLDLLISTFDNKQLFELKENAQFIDWLDEVLIDNNDELKYQGYKPGRGKSLLYFKDKYMMRQNNIFSAENANEGILHVLFYIALFASDRTPHFFAIDNIENSLNPRLCRALIKKVSELSVSRNKQALITTHNPAILDGLNLHDDHQRLFVVKRNDEGHTQIERINLKPRSNGEQLKLSEMWMRGHLGGLPTNF
ncbi:MAG: AAA family ATPase [Saprospiraceae bacterium]|nr:AAA family ATPase [Saprospiraceae bacterium]